MTLKITLKKAHVVSQALLEHAKANPPPLVLDLSVFDPAFGGDFTSEKVRAAVDKALVVAGKAAEVATAMAEAAFRIRGAVGVRQTEVGLDRLLAERKGVETALSHLNPRSDGVASRLRALSQSGSAVTARTGEDLVAKAVSRLRYAAQQVAKEGATNQGPDVQVDLSAAFLETVEARRRALRRRLEDIGEELIRLNHSTHVELSDDEVSLARIAGVLD